MNRIAAHLPSIALSTLLLAGIPPAMAQSQAGQNSRSIPPAWDGELVWFLHFAPDPTVSPNCDDAPFIATGAGVERAFTAVVPPDDGRVEVSYQMQVGSATACTAPDPTTPGRMLNFVKLDLLGVSLQGLGSCQGAGTLKPGVLTGSCILVIRNPPDGYSSGLVTTNTLLNPLNDPDFPARSDCYWTVRLFR